MTLTRAMTLIAPCIATALASKSAASSDSEPASTAHSLDLKLARRTCLAPVRRLSRPWMDLPICSSLATNAVFLVERGVHLREGRDQPLRGTRELRGHSLGAPHALQHQIFDQWLA